MKSRSAKHRAVLISGLFMSVPAAYAGYPCAAKNPCAAKHPCAGENPCAGKK